MTFYSILDVFDRSTLHGFEGFCVSAFDHVLSEEEAFNNEIICYSVANDKGKLDEYMIFENKFRKLFYVFFEKNQNSFIAVDGSYGGGRVKSINRFDKFLSLALRERKVTSIAFPLIGVIVEFGYDQTHIFYLEKGVAKNSDFLLAVKCCGLHVLRA